MFCPYAANKYLLTVCRMKHDWLGEARTGPRGFWEGQQVLPENSGLGWTPSNVLARPKLESSRLGSPLETLYPHKQRFPRALLVLRLMFYVSGALDPLIPRDTGKSSLPYRWGQ